MKRRGSLFPRWVLGIVLFLQLPALGVVHAEATPVSPDDNTRTPIKHLVVLMQENHTFDNYFGTYPGADGIPAGTKMPVDPHDQNNQGVVESFHIGNYPVSDLSHSNATFLEQYDNGRMDGFVSALNNRKQNGTLSMGYYDGRDIPYYWNLADHYVLFDRFFSSATSGSFANHFYWVAAAPPVSENVRTGADTYANLPTIFDRLEQKGISWKFYVQNYDSTINYRNLAGGGNRASQVVWVPLLNFDRFLDNPELAKHIVDLDQYYVDLHNGTLPAVAYIAPSGASEHPPGSIQTGQRFVKTLIQELMRSRYWDSSAFMLLYDDWGGWYDHVTPPQVDQYGYGLRVPGLLVSAYAKKGYIDHTQLDFTSILKFIEENWNISSLQVRDAQANNFLDAFDFDQLPRDPAFISNLRSAGPGTVAARPTRVIYMGYGVALFLAVFIIGFALIYAVFVRDRQLPHRIREEQQP